MESKCIIAASTGEVGGRRVDGEEPEKQPFVVKIQVKQTQQVITDSPEQV